MKILSSAPVIHISDFEQALQYYTGVLGFDIDFRLPAYAGLILGHAMIYISGPDSPGLKKAPGSAHFCFDCDEVDNYYNEIVKQGALISVTIGDRFYGVRDFAVADHDGNTLIFGKYIGG